MHSSKECNDSDYENDSDDEVDDEGTARYCQVSPRPSLNSQPAKLFNPGNYKQKLSPLTSILSLHEDIVDLMCGYLNFNDQLSLFLASNRIINIVSNSRAILKRFVLQVNEHSLQQLTKHHELLNIPFLNVELDLNKNIKSNEILKFYQKVKYSVTNLTIKNGKFHNFCDFLKIIDNIANLESLSLEYCNIETLKNEALPEISTLKVILLKKCTDNIFKALVNQKVLEKTTVINHDWTFNGFPHDKFNQIAKNSKNHITSMVFEGAGTGSYFDCDEFPFQISELDSTMITFHWYVGIKSQRTSFLESQMGVLKDLRIHQWPNDFDGGRVLRFIFNHMNLDNFYYKNTPLVLDKEMQQVTKIEVTEIQVQCLLELVRQFPSITSICLNLSTTDIASDQIEKVINPTTDLFKNVIEFEVVDNSKYRSIFGVFLGLLKNLTNVRKLSLKTPDRNINCLLEEFLPYMDQVTEIYLTSTANRSRERFLTIQKFAPCLNKISVAPQYLDEAKKIFGHSAEVCLIENAF